MSLKPYQIFIDDSSTRLIAGRNTFSRSLGGVLVIPAGSTFPTSSYARELFWNIASGALYVRNEANTDWIGMLGADVNASYLTLANTGSLTSERAFVAGTGLLGTDAGAGSTYTLSIDNDVVATVSGTTFTGPVLASNLSGSLQKTTSGLSYLVAGSGIQVSSASNGQITITNTVGATGADPDATYVTLSATASLSNERVLSVSGTVLTLTDDGAGSTVTIGLPTTGTHGTYGEIAVNEYGQVTSGSTSWFGQNFWFVTGSSSVPFHNSTTTYRSALELTASNLTEGIYRLGWNYTFRNNSTTNSFRCRTFILNSASFDTVEEMSDASANERAQRGGFTYVRITGSVALFSLDMSIEAAATNTTASMYDRAIELWRVT